MYTCMCIQVLVCVGSYVYMHVYRFPCVLVHVYTGMHIRGLRLMSAIHLIYSEGSVSTGLAGQLALGIP